MDSRIRWANLVCSPDVNDSRSVARTTDVGARYLDMMRLSSGAGVDNGNNKLRCGGELGVVLTTIQIEKGYRRNLQDILMHVRSPFGSKNMRLWGAVKLMLSTFPNSLSPHGFGMFIRRLLKEVTLHV